MGLAVCSGAQCRCSFGAAPCVLNVLPTNRVLGCSMPLATIMDKEIINLPTFGMCMTATNPAVASATAAALGVLTPMPCVPVIPAPWMPGSPTVLIASIPALNNTSQAMCAWGGVISIVNPGQTSILIP